MPSGVMVSCYRSTVLAVASLMAVPSEGMCQDTQIIERLQRHDARAQQLFDEGEYEAALVELRAAHDLAPAAPRLFSMAVCEQRLGHVGAAIDLYRQYLAASDTDEEHNERARRQIAQLERQLREGGDDDPSAVTFAHREEGERRRLSPTPFIVTASLTGALIVSFAILGGITLGMHDEFMEASPDETRYHDLQDRGWRQAVVTDVLLGLSCLSATISVVLAALTDWDSGRAAERTTIGPGIGPGFAYLSISRRF